MVKAAKAHGSRLELSDERCIGLKLRVTPNGVKSWSFLYRMPGGRKADVRRTPLGHFPEVSLAAAREAADKCRADAKKGKDPRAAVAVERGAGITFDEMAEEFLTLYSSRKKDGGRDDRGFLKRPRAAWGKRPAISITDDDVAELLHKVVHEDQAPVAANRIQSALSKLFNWAREPGRKYVTTNHCSGIKRQKEKPKQRHLTPAEIKKLWRAIDQADTPRGNVSRIPLKLILCTIARSGMVVGARKSELVNLNGRAPEWHVPAERMKNGKAFIVPLNKFAADLFKEAIAESGEGDLIFVSKFEARDNGVAVNTLSHAVEEIVEHLGMEKFTPHDLRRTGATTARKAGAPFVDVQALLSHTPQDVTSRHYDMYDKLKEKRQVADILGRRLGVILR
ncbi:MAG TPA: tyrosine-type recombinase/integrase [Bradyrhizobium sp.]|jgi:integrase